MDQEKVGRFIADCRKKKNLTQKQLAEKLGITDRAISKWENGKAMPDSSVMLQLCSELGISVNELLSGENVVIDNYNNNAENNLLGMVKQKEETDKQLLFLEIVIGILSMIILLSLTAVAAFIEMEDWIRTLLIITGFIPCIIGMLIALRIEQTAGYYECRKCHQKYVPTYSRVLWAMHINRTRYMKCPKCGKRSWNRKVISK